MSHGVAGHASARHFNFNGGRGGTFWKTALHSARSNSVRTSLRRDSVCWFGRTVNLSMLVLTYVIEKRRVSAVRAVAMPCEVVPQGVYIGTCLVCRRTAPLSQRGVVAVAVSKLNKRCEERFAGRFCVSCTLLCALLREWFEWNASCSWCIGWPACLACDVVACAIVAVSRKPVLVQWRDSQCGCFLVSPLCVCGAHQEQVLGAFVRLVGRHAAAPQPGHLCHGGSTKWC